MNAISSRGDADRRLRLPALPVAGLAGTSFKHEHLNSIMAEGSQAGFFEVHAENYMGAGGPPHRSLERIRRDHPVSLHGVCMSIGGPQPLDQAHLARFRALVERYEPTLVSEHLAWSTHETTYFNDLLPLPYTQTTLAQVCEHIDEVQDAIGRRILIGNPSTYVTFASSTMSETDFIRAITCRTGCGLLLDVNNVFVSATNHGYAALDYLSGSSGPGSTPITRRMCRRCPRTCSRPFHRTGLVIWFSRRIRRLASCDPRIRPWRSSR